MSSLKQRVPMGRTAKGEEVFVTVEWLKDLNRDISAVGTTTTVITSADLIALTAQITVAVANLTALAARVKKLEQGYQA